LIATCAFETSRLVVAEWHATAVRSGCDLVDAVVGILDDTTTAALPEAWRGSYPPERARAFIAERDAESVSLLVVERAMARPVGLVVLFEIPSEGMAGRVDVRLGYVFAAQDWGNGFASEMVAGLVSWCAEQAMIRSIVAGVAVDNPASARVLTKNGFACVGVDQHDEQLYELELDE
jgi:RimJ/RimL family protein N-acetyltransferase